MIWKKYNRSGRDSKMKNNQEVPVLIFGTAGAAKDVYYWVKAMNKVKDNKLIVQGFVELLDAQIGNTVFDNKKIVTSDSNIDQYISSFKKIGLIIPFGQPEIRRRLYLNLKHFDNVFFPNIIHPSVVYDAAAGSMGIGNILGPGVTIASEFTIGDFNYVSINAALGHDINIGNFNSINPSATTAGNVKIGNQCYIGMSSAIIQEIKIADKVTVGAGAVVISEPNTGETLVGVPARAIVSKK